ncbi:hypothetical protein [Aeromonas finlandensis]|uniref:hypothetical protein n=1 Tax=Aeromonas finlandensis TaxID=1543375 RepID=UPI0012E03B52|nr:hypothetical protein [Aeromonas finlandensis]
MHNRFSILMICLMAQRPSARAEPASGGFKGGHYKEFGAQIAPFVALATSMVLNNTTPAD